VHDQLPRLGVDVEVVVGETPLSHSLIMVVTVLEIDEVLGEVLDDGDMLQAKWKTMTDGPLDDFWLHHRAVSS
jgi:hypothetical protein